MQDARLVVPFCVLKTSNIRNKPRTSGPLIHEPTPSFDLFQRTGRNGGLCLCRFKTENFLNLLVDFVVWV